MYTATNFEAYSQLIGEVLMDEHKVWFFMSFVVLDWEQLKLKYEWKVGYYYSEGKNIHSKTCLNIHTYDGNVKNIYGGYSHLQYIVYICNCTTNRNVAKIISNFSITNQQQTTSAA